MKYNGVILSGTPGAGKSVLAQKLIEAYNWEKLSLGDYWKKAYQIAHPTKDIDFASFWRSTSREENQRINREAREALKIRSIVCDSRYTAAYCQDLPLLLVYLNAPIETRAYRLLGSNLYAGMDVSQVAAKLVEREDDEVRRGKEFFGEPYDYRNATWYDLILNSNTHSIEDEFKIIQERLSSTLFLPRLMENVHLN